MPTGSVRRKTTSRPIFATLSIDTGWGQGGTLPHGTKCYPDLWLKRIRQRRGNYCTGSVRDTNSLLDSFCTRGIRTSIFSAFAREPWILSQFLNLSGNETVVRQQDFFFAVRYVATNPVGECDQIIIHFSDK